MRDYLSCRTAAEVRLENDGNAAALAEFHQGAGRGFEDMLYCPVSTGCSSAIVINGHIFHGSYGWAGESGHALITPGDGPYCGCENRGCFMSHISGYMIVQRVIQRIQDGAPTELPDMVKGDLSKLTAEHILRGAQVTRCTGLVGCGPYGALYGTVVIRSVSNFEHQLLCFWRRFGSFRSTAV